MSKALNFNGIKRRVLADDTLTKKASLNALAAALDYAAKLIVAFVTTPLMVAGLGKYFFGAWQVLNRLLTYMTPASGRPTQALKFTIARDQASEDTDQKRRYVGSAFVVWVLFLPVLVVLGAVVVWMAPAWMKASPAQVLPIRFCTGLLVGNLIITNIATIPMSVLQGANLGYKRMGLTTVTVFFGGLLVWLALYLRLGLVGVGAAALVSTLVSGVVFFAVTRKYASWFRISIPPFRETSKFLGLSVWFMGWNLVMQLMTASDVVVLGLVGSVEMVTDFTLSKYAPETLISIVAMITFGISPGLGGIIGAGDLKKAAAVRGEIMAWTWLTSTALGAAILIWNPSFLNLWVGPEHYVGPTAAFLITVVITQFVLIRSDAVIIDLTLNLRRKVLVGLASAAASIVISALFLGPLHMGIAGLSLGLILGRSLLSVSYPSILGRFLRLDFLSQVRSCLRPVLVTIVLFAASAWVGDTIQIGRKLGLLGWAAVAAGGALTGAVLIAFTFYAGLGGHQRSVVFRRLRAVVGPGSRRAGIEHPEG